MATEVTIYETSTTSIGVYETNPVTITISNLQGPQGPAGATGPTGATGAQGPSGVINIDAGELTNTGSSTSAQLGLANAGTAGTYTKVTTDQFGRVSSGTTLSESDIPSLSPSKITGLLTTLVQDPDLLVVGSITRDSSNVVTSAAVVWPDGVSGTYTSLSFDSATGAVNSYQITKGSATYTQPTLTRNSAGAVTNRPAIVVT